MNRKTKIVVSVAGILIVTLALIGLTYAYFLTRINGNTNSKSISASTQKLELTYSDGNGTITGSNIVPGDSLDSKTFSVTNNGSDTSYIVVLENVTVIDESNNITTFENNDFRYTLTCASDCNGATDEVLPLSNGVLVSNDIKKGATQEYTLTVTYKETGLDQSNDMGKTLEARVNISTMEKFNPYSTNKESLAYNIINNAAIKKNGTELLSTPRTKVAEEISEYGTGKKFNETIQTSSLCSGTDPWHVGDTEESAKSGSSVSSYEAAVGKYVYDDCSQWTKKLIAYDSATNTLTFESPEMVSEKTLSIARDDYGTSYYYRGAVKDNYLELNSICFRIVRIEGDGSVKVTLANNGPCSTSSTDTGFVKEENGTDNKRVVYGYEKSNSKYYFNYEGYEGGLYTTLNDWYNTKMASVQSKLKNETWCLGGKTSKYEWATGALLDATSTNTSWYYETGKRLYGKGQTPEATYMCSSEADRVTGYVGALIADEVVYAGGKAGNFNYAYYLRDNAEGANYWLLSRAWGGSVDLAFDVEDDGEFYIGSVYDSRVDGSNVVRPALTIATGAEISSGDGTQNNPYTIK